MKKILFSFVFAVLFFKLFSQPILNYENYGLRVGDQYTVQESKTFEPGQSGKNVIWDFTGLICNSDKSVTISDGNNISTKNFFLNSNITAEDDGNYYFFEVDKNSNKILGFITPQAIIKYDNPIVRTKFPFAYGDSVQANYTGHGLYYDVVQTHIWGSLQIKADAEGTLLLPGGAVLNHVLRIKTMEKTFESGCKLFQITNIKYMWYAEGFRYPILTETEKTKFDVTDSTIIKSSFYNETAVASIINTNLNLISDISNDNSLFSVYPNPYVSEFHIKYNLKKSTRVDIEIMNTLGITVLNIVDNQKQIGQYDYTCNSEKISSGTYFVKIIFDNAVFMRKLVKTD
jgi:hypothetical protein